jgi:outer membrane protein assembly factor BamB
MNRTAPIAGAWRRALPVVVVAAVAAPAVEAWPMFRGDAAQTGLTTAPIAERYDLAWTYATGGACTSAVVADGLAVVGSGGGKVHAVDLASGKARWSVDLGAGIDATPLILDGAAIVGSTEGRLVSLALADGAIRWEAKAGDKITGAATWFMHAGTKRVLVGSYDSNLYCFNAADGAGVWKYETGSYINGTPAIGTLEGRQVAVAGGCDAKLHVVDLADGSKLREIPVSAYIAASVAVADGRAYVGHYGNEVIAADLVSGAVTWTYKDRNFPYFSSPAVTAEVVVLGGRDRRIHCLDRGTGKARWVAAARGNVDGSPLIGGDRVLIGSDDGRLYLFDLADGKERWSYEVGDKLSGAPAIAGGRLLVGGDDGNLYAFTPGN